MPERMQIGELADKTGLSLRTIRHYDEVGLLHPSDRSDGGFRLYDDDDLERLMVIRRMKPLGFSLDEMGEVLDIVHALENTPAETDVAAARERLQGFIVDAEQRRERLRDHLAWADEFIAQLRSR
ncbi:MerR family transcriptional regulator [Marisediminicola sp. LYQ134]|uniref:MerR family transcriptional regulator n=1 Tax=unclassified Marisediminicola TaxID=2618316 RepID=UPI0039837F30